MEIQQNQLLFNEADFKTVCEFFDFKKMKLVSDVSYLGYDPELTLAAAFADPCPSKDYRGSPFVLTNADKVSLSIH